MERDYHYYPYSFEPFALEKENKLYYYHNDINGAPLRLIDETGNIVWNVHYDIFGKIDKQKINEVHNPIRMQGQYEDEETGLYYNRYRYYDPAISAYVSQDPLGLGAGENVYSYVKNSFGWIDPLGLSCEKVQPNDIVKYGNKSEGLENHHGVLDVWAKNNVPNYKSRASDSPTIALTPEQHSNTKAVYRDWLEEKTGKRVGGKVNWSEVSPKEMQNLSEKMFDSANVPDAARREYYSEFNKYIYGLN